MVCWYQVTAGYLGNPQNCFHHKLYSMRFVAFYTGWVLHSTALAMTNFKNVGSLMNF